MELRERLAQLRKERGLTQAALAESLRVSRQAVSRWEVGTSIPTSDNLIALSGLYGISVDELIGKRETETADPAQGDIAMTAEPEPPKTATNRPWLKKAVMLAAALLVALMAVFCVYSILHLVRERPKEPAEDTVSTTLAESHAPPSGDG